jgi:hypothetical protein
MTTVNPLIWRQSLVQNGNGALNQTFSVFYVCVG